MNPKLEELTQLALEVTGITRERWDSLMKAMADADEMNRIMKTDWEIRPRDSEASIRDYYRDSDIWFVNTFAHAWETLIKISTGWMSPIDPWEEVLAKHLKDGALLDYGGGFFKDTWKLLNAGALHVVQAEVKGPVTKYLKEFFRRLNDKNAGTFRSIKASVLEVDSSSPLSEMYGGACCFETLEHLLEPKALMEHLLAHLKPGAPFAFSASFGAPEHAPYHVAKNARLGDAGVWERYLKSLKMEPIWKAEDGHRQIWRKAP